MKWLINLLFRKKELKLDYEELGFNLNSEELLTNYKKALNLFESEFEI